eukprot:1922552-Prymnesium_polylepis.1
MANGPRTLHTRGTGLKPTPRDHPLHPHSHILYAPLTQPTKGLAHSVLLASGGSTEHCVLLT